MEGRGAVRGRRGGCCRWLVGVWCAWLRTEPAADVQGCSDGLFPRVLLLAGCALNGRERVVPVFEGEEVEEEELGFLVAYGEHGVEIGVRGRWLEEAEAHEEGFAVGSGEFEEAGVGELVFVDFLG